MKSAWIKNNSARKLILFFGGFACDKNLLKSVSISDDFDILIIYDYRNFDMPNIPEYDAVYVLAWSFGVWVADKCSDRIKNAISFTAINGSPIAVDKDFGIDPEIFKKTTDTFNDKNKDRFFKRICGGIKEYENLKSYLCDRNSNDLKLELESFAGEFNSDKKIKANWNAYISRSDKIFNTENLLRVFKNVQIEEGEHLNILLIEKLVKKISNRSKKIKASFEKNSPTYEAQASVQNEMSKTLANLIFDNFGDSNFKSILEIGVGTGFLTRQLAQKYSSATYFINDLSDKLCDIASKFCDNFNIKAGDYMNINFGNRFDLICSSSTFQWFENQTKLFEKINCDLNKDGILAFSTFGKKNFIEIRNAENSGLEYSSLPELLEKLKWCNFEIIQSKEELIKLEFDRPIDVLKHIRATGVNSIFTKVWNKTALSNFCKNYNISNNQTKTYLSYNPIYIIAKKIK